MYQIREVFRCRPGKARLLVEKLQAAGPVVEREDGFRHVRVLTDFVADYWTVVWEAEVDDLAQFERHMATYGARPEIRDAMAGYLDLVDGGHREIWKVV